MKKRLLTIVYLLASLVIFAQNKFNIPKVGYKFQPGANVTNVVNGNVIYAEKDAKKALKSSMNIPEELANGIVIVEYTDDYYYNGELKHVKFQFLYSNLTPDAKFLKASEEKPVEIKDGDVLGKAKGEIALVIRARTLDPHLTLCSKTLPLEVGPFWYFGLDSFDPSVAKYLYFQPINSRNDEIIFPDSIAETIDHIVRTPEPDVLASFPVMPVKFKTVMTEKPFAKHDIKNSGERLLHMQNLANSNLEVVVELDGVVVHLYFPQSFAEYFEKEYKLGDPIWFFGNTLYVLNNELHLYGRDFTLVDPESTINEKQNYIILLNRQNRAAENAKNPVNEENDYVDVTQSIPKGGYAVYERFFFMDEKSPTGYKENHTNSAIEYFDKNGNRVARMFPYNDTDMIRSTQTYKYDKKNREIEYCNYDSYMYQEKGAWKVDPKRSRIFNKRVTEYNDSANETKALSKEYRYSYKPTVERLEKKITKNYSANGTLLRLEEISVTGDVPDSIEEYDEKGNLIYDTGFGEEKYEYKYEYVYDGDKILSKKSTNLISKTVTETTYTYDDKGLLTETKNQNVSTSYKYNSKGKLIESCSFNNEGTLILRYTMRYDEKTGILLFRFEENFGKYESRRFWYYEFSKDNWDMELTPEKILEKLPE